VGFDLVFSSTHQLLPFAGPLMKLANHFSLTVTKREGILSSNFPCVIQTRLQPSHNKCRIAKFKPEESSAIFGQKTYYPDV
jgi:hypothetical protein